MEKISNQILTEIQGIKKVSEFKSEMIEFKQETRERLDKVESKIDGMDKKIEVIYYKTAELIEGQDEMKRGLWKVEIVTASNWQDIIKLKSIK